MKIVSTIEARMASSRLPGKILKDVLGKPMLERMIERVRRSKLVNQVVVATTVDPSDQATEDACKAMGVACFRGSSDDVLLRVLEAAKAHKADLIVELTGDCPVIDHGLIDQVIRFYLDNDFDYASNVLHRDFPRGTEVQVFSVKVLDEVNRITQDPADHEHVSLYIYEHPEKFKLGTLSAPPELKRPDLRLTVDLPQDLELVRAVYGRLHPQKPDFDIHDVVRLLSREPELGRLNATIQQKPVR
ncbi:MAG TPA: glycosyltransferase family protein [Verrucomicrobiae bacterium]|nr:glycosyltransferase family protein [Verrucomicrobiae bacterium]